MSLFKEKVSADDEFYLEGYRKKSDLGKKVIYESIRDPKKYIELDLSMNNPHTMLAYDPNMKAMPITARESIAAAHKAIEYYKLRR